MYTAVMVIESLLRSTTMTTTMTAPAGTAATNDDDDDGSGVWEGMVPLTRGQR
jgi:hypothetical protein